ncbi:hypothetical protein Hanom_Chr00s000133g01624981 [Helianthus anomalus]
MIQSDATHYVVDQYFHKLDHQLSNEFEYLNILDHRSNKMMKISYILVFKSEKFKIIIIVIIIILSKSRQ